MYITKKLKHKCKYVIQYQLFILFMSIREVDYLVLPLDIFWRIFAKVIFMKQLKGILYVGIGASSYGVLATFVKLANTQEIHTAGLTFSQYLFGFLVLSILSYVINIKRRAKGVEPIKANKKIGRAHV